MEIELLSALSGRRLAQWQTLLERVGLEADRQFDTVCLLWQEDTLAAAGCRYGNLLKCIAVSPAHRGEDLTATVLTQLRQDAFRIGLNHLFLYTKPQNLYQFSALFFYPVAQTDRVLLMENRCDGIGSFLRTLPAPVTAGRIGGAVMNCDPFTLGHQYLIETAAGDCDHLYVFVLSEDAGRFSPAQRIEMVRRGVSHLPNVTVLPTGPYLISAATFPTYFLKDRDSAPEAQCLLDIEIFLRYYVPRFGITCRYVGTEPLSPLTDRYNRALKARLPQRGVALLELPRRQMAGEPVSASHIRALLAAGDAEACGQLVPESTMDFIRGIEK